MKLCSWIFIMPRKVISLKAAPGNSDRELAFLSQFACFQCVRHQSQPYSGRDLQYLSDSCGFRMEQAYYCNAPLAHAEHDYYEPDGAELNVIMRHHKATLPCYFSIWE